MAEIIWSDLAVEDLRSIYEFIAADSVFYASRQTERLIARTEQLQAFPASGRIVPEFDNPDLRELIEGNYRFIYKLGSEMVYIVRVHHASRMIG